MVVASACLARARIVTRLLPRILLPHRKRGRPPTRPAWLWSSVECGPPGPQKRGRPSRGGGEPTWQGTGPPAKRGGLTSAAPGGLRLQASTLGAITCATPAIATDRRVRETGLLGNVKGK